MAVDMFLKIDGVVGESTDDKHKGEIDIQSFSWGESNLADVAQGSGGGAGKVSMQDFHFVTPFTKASVALFLGCASGEHFPQAALSVRKAGGDQPQEYLRWTLSDVQVTSYQTGASAGGDDRPFDSFSLNFSKIEVSYKEQKPDGSLGTEHRAGWDLSKNTKV
jgi:type VI secretion system secreted protein Hcp